MLEAGSGVSPMFDELDTLDLEMPSAADSGISSTIHGPADRLGFRLGHGPWHRALKTLIGWTWDRALAAVRRPDHATFR